MCHSPGGKKSQARKIPGRRSCQVILLNHKALWTLITVDNSKLSVDATIHLLVSPLPNKPGDRDVGKPHPRRVFSMPRMSWNFKLVLYETFSKTASFPDPEWHKLGFKAHPWNKEYKPYSYSFIFLLPWEHPEFSWLPLLALKSWLPIIHTKYELPRLWLRNRHKKNMLLSEDFWKGPKLRKREPQNFLSEFLVLFCF